MPQGAHHLQEGEQVAFALGVVEKGCHRIGFGNAAFGKTALLFQKAPVAQPLLQLGQHAHRRPVGAWTARQRLDQPEQIRGQGLQLVGDGGAGVGGKEAQRFRDGDMALEDVIENLLAEVAAEVAFGLPVDLSPTALQLAHLLAGQFFAGQQQLFQKGQAAIIDKRLYFWALIERHVAFYKVGQVGSHQRLFHWRRLGVDAHKYGDFVQWMALFLGGFDLFGNGATHAFGVGVALELGDAAKATGQLQMFFSPPLVVPDNTVG